jgi:hypothetical protein
LVERRCLRLEEAVIEHVQRDHRKADWRERRFAAGNSEQPRSPFTARERRQLRSQLFCHRTS